MRIVDYITTTGESFLTDVARNTFLSLVTASGTLVGYMAVLAVALVGMNMMIQFRPISWPATIGLMIKLALIGIFAWNWNQFWNVANAIIKAIEAIAAQILVSAGSSWGGSTIADGFGAAIDRVIEKLSIASTNIASEMGGWFMGGLVGFACTVGLVLIGAASAVMILFPKVVITILLGLAPIAIAMTLFDNTKNYFERWASACVSWALYPIFIASIFAIMIGMGNKMVADIGTDSFGSIGAFIPFLILEALVVICIACLPMLVSSVSGNLQQMGVLAAGRLAAGGLGTMASAGMRSFGAARSIASTPAQTLRGQNALGRAGQAFGAHPAVQRASTGVALTLNRMQERARLLRK